MKVSYSELEKGVKIMFKKSPCQIIETSPMFKGRGSSVLRAKLKNLVSGEVFSHTFQSSDVFLEADIKKINIQFIYSHRGKFVFSKDNERISLSEEQIKDRTCFLKPNQEVEALVLGDQIININLPVKIQLKVTQTPPGIQGNRSQAGNKTATLETGIKINVPLFIKQGDTIEINTETKEYVRRII